MEKLNRFFLWLRFHLLAQLGEPCEAWEMELQQIEKRLGVIRAWAPPDEKQAFERGD